MRTLIKNEEQFKILEDFLKNKQYDLSIDTYEYRCNDGEPFIHIKEEAISDFNNVNYSDFNNPNCSSNSASLTEYSLNVSDVEYKLKELIEEYGDIEFDSDWEEIVDDLIDIITDDFQDYSNDNYKELLHKDFGDINKSSQNLIYDISSELKLKGQYTRFDFEDLEENDKSIQVRISDHSHNPKNNHWNNMDYNISIVIANKDNTIEKFNQLGKGNCNEIYFKSDDTVEEIVERFNAELISIKEYLNII